jgi:molecular chaperone IbpA
MNSLTKYNSNTLIKLFEDLDRYSIGLDNWFDRVSTVTYPQSNYPPYNLIKESETQYKLEVAASGFKPSELTVYTENNQLVIEAEKSCKDDKEYIYRSLSHRNFKRIWSLADDVIIKSVNFEDGLLTIHLEKIIPEHQKKKIYF